MHTTEKAWGKQYCLRSSCRSLMHVVMVTVDSATKCHLTKDWWTFILTIQSILSFRCWWQISSILNAANHALTNKIPDAGPIEIVGLVVIMIIIIMMKMTIKQTILFRFSAWFTSTV